VLRDLHKKLVELLTLSFEEFKETDQCDQFVAMAQSKILDEDEKRNFDVGEQVLAFEIEIRGKKDKKNTKKKLFRLDMNQNMATVGRDHASDILIDDDKVSRSHGRFEYGRNFCKYLDLGSSHGSKVNGESQTNADLALGDVVKVGNTTMKLVLVDQKFFKRMLDSIRSAKVEV